MVIDEDQGRSGGGQVARPGFQTLLAAVCGSEVGAVFALEASRLARNNRDWHHLIDLCALTRTLIVDGEGVYDPRQLNDRLLLGLKGTMSEFELGLFRERARKAFEMKIGRGHALWGMPVGLVRNEEDRIEEIADRQVQAAIASVFRKFRELGSARQVTLWFRDENIPLPEIVPGTRGQEVVWRLPRGHRINQILKNPGYAGALAYGRTEGRMTVEDGRARKASSRSTKPREAWKVLILDNHTGYISWEEYLENQTMLEANLSKRSSRWDWPWRRRATRWIVPDTGMTMSIPPTAWWPANWKHAGTRRWNVSPNSRSNARGGTTSVRSYVKKIGGSYWNWGVTCRCCGTIPQPRSG